LVFGIYRWGLVSHLVYIPAKKGLRLEVEKGS
jgi:hypothetical protein